MKNRVAEPEPVDLVGAGAARAIRLEPEPLRTIRSEPEPELEPEKNCRLRLQPFNIKLS